MLYRKCCILSLIFFSTLCAGATKKQDVLKTLQQILPSESLILLNNTYSVSAYELAVHIERALIDSKYSVPYVISLEESRLSGNSTKVSLFCDTKEIGAVVLNNPKPYTKENASVLIRAFRGFTQNRGSLFRHDLQGNGLN